MHHSDIKSDVRKLIADGTVIPAHPLALDAGRKLDPRHQRALSRYYIDSGAGGLAAGLAGVGDLVARDLRFQPGWRADVGRRRRSGKGDRAIRVGAAQSQSVDARRRFNREARARCNDAGSD